MRILIAEPIAEEGVALLRAGHEVDERPGLTRDELCAIGRDPNGGDAAELRIR